MSMMETDLEGVEPHLLQLLEIERNAVLAPMRYLPCYASQVKSLLTSGISQKDLVLGPGTLLVFPGFIILQWIPSR